MDKRNQMNIVSVRLGTVIGVVTSYTTSYVRNFLASIFGQQYQYFVVAIIYGAAYLATTGLMVSLLKPYDGVSAAGGPSRPRVKISIGDMVKAIFTNSQLLVNFISGFMFFTGAFAPMQIVMYYYVYIRNDPQLTLYATAQTATMLFSLATTVVGPAIGLKLGRLKAMLYGQLLTAISGLLMILFGSISIYAFIGINMFTGLATSLYSGFGFSYIIDCGEYGYWKSGVDNRVVVNSLGSIPMKIAQLIAGTVALYGMSMIGFTAGMEVTDSFTKNFMVLYGGIPLVCNSIAFICNLLFYKIDDKEAELYARENREREAAAAAALES
jgi:GPH family glycoside/pentoside/hexuronide:cation symporter